MNFRQRYTIDVTVEIEHMSSTTIRYYHPDAAMVADSVRAQLTAETLKILTFNAVDDWQRVVGVIIRDAKKQAEA